MDPPSPLTKVRTKRQSLTNNYFQRYPTPTQAPSPSTSSVFARKRKNAASHNSPSSPQIDIFQGPAPLSPLLDSPNVMEQHIEALSKSAARSKISPSSSTSQIAVQKPSRIPIRRSTSTPPAVAFPSSSPPLIKSRTRHRSTSIVAPNHAPSLPEDASEKISRYSGTSISSFSDTPPESPVRPSIPSIDDIIRAHRPSNASQLTPTKARSYIPSVNDIVRDYQGKLSTSANIFAPARQREMTNESSGRESIDSVTHEVFHSIQAQNASHNSLHHARSLPSLKHLPLNSIASINSDEPDDVSIGYQSLSLDTSLPYGLRNFSTPTRRHASLSPTPSQAQSEIIQYIRSARLTKILKLERPPNHHLSVSLADVGAPDGHPIIVFLGLGCVRYLVALYDEIATALGLRLIAIDRWGLGKSKQIPDSKRGFGEWAAIVQEVADQLNLSTYSIIAHSAGSPFALAAALREPQRVVGTIHLLAPWVLQTSDSNAATRAGSISAYKWLKYVPNGVIRTAHAAEWKVQSWKLGKPPESPVEGVGFDKNAPVASHGPLSPAIKQEDRSDYSWEESTSQSDITVLTPTRPAKSSKKFLGGLFSPKLESPSLRSVSPRLSNLPASPNLPGRSFSDSRRKSTPSKSRQSSSPTSASSDLGTAIMRASHHEAQGGGSTSDLLLLLSPKPAPFNYCDIEIPVKAWYGDQDDRITLASVCAMVGALPKGELEVLKGADHDLMSNVGVVTKVLKAIKLELEEMT